MLLFVYKSSIRYTLEISPISERHLRFSFPPAKHRANGTRHIGLINITKTKRHTNETIAEIMCTNSSVLSNTFAPPQVMIPATPKNTSHFQFSGAIVNSCGASKICDHKANSNTHLKFPASAEMLFCVPPFNDMYSRSDVKITIPIKESVTILLLDLVFPDIRQLYRKIQLLQPYSSRLRQPYGILLR